MSLDPVVVASKQYSVVVDNAKVRVLKVSYGPHEQAASHLHPDSVLVTLTEMNTTFTYPDGKSEDVRVPAGTAVFMAGTTHATLNKTGNRFDGYLIELKH